MEIIEGRRPAQTFEIADLVTITREEYEDLQKRAERADATAMAVWEFERGLNARLRAIGRQR